MIEHTLFIKSSSADAPHRIVISLIIVVRVPVVQVRVPSLLRRIAVRSTRPVISRDEKIRYSGFYPKRQDYYPFLKG
ncbi:hypothetical protein H3C66_05000 [Patescibacteria group bacterium]|nr:hypothetical protein [Patescibacteria group bacterium]